MLVIAVAVAGLAVGAYLPGVVTRVPAGDGVFAGEPRPELNRRAMILAVATAVVLALIALRLGADPALPAFLVFGVIGVALAVIDLDCHRLPDKLTLPAYPIGLVLLGIAALIEQDLAAYLRALGGMVALFVFFYLLAVISPGGMGFGDVKLAGAVGLYLGWLGWGELILGAFLAFIVSAVVSIGLIAARRATLKSKVPFGPFLLIGPLVAVLLGTPVLDWYLGA